MRTVRSTVLTGPGGLLSCARDVDYYHRNVVGTAVALGEVREFGSGLLRAGGGLQNGAHRRFADMAVSPSVHSTVIQTTADHRLTPAGR